MKILKEFKNFAVKGNVVDLAVGVIIGGAFGKIVSSLVADILMPPISLLLGGVNFTNLNIVFKKASENNELISFNYGLFLQNIFNFVIITFSIFIFIKLINSLKEKEEVKKAQKKSEEVKILEEIRDLLKSKNT
jgi:large conductance mechanosensitive channel